MPADATNNSFLLQVDSTNCYTISSSTGAGTWLWSDYQNNDSASKVSLSLTQGSHAIKLIGNAPGVKVDRIVLVADQGAQTCVPTGFGDNCNTPDDTTPPTVSLTGPASGSTVSGSVNVTATASDNVGVTKVEFYVNSQLAATSTTSPYSFSWDTTKVANGTQTLIVKAYDAAGNNSADSYSVSVQNSTGGTGGGGGTTPDTQLPSAPTGVTATATDPHKVVVKWNASTDNVGIKGYYVYRNNAIVAQVGNVTTYTDTTVLPNTTYRYIVSAIDTSNNEGDNSAAAQVTTPNVAGDTQAPTAPGPLTAQAANSKQVNLNWGASTDNVGVAGYDVYRSTKGGTPKKVATVTTTSYGDTGLTAGTAYSYYVKARDPSGNTSNASNTVNVTTPKALTRATLTGTVTSGSTKIFNATVAVTTNGTKYTTTTNRHGRYVIRGVPGGHYSVTYRASGYVSRSNSLTLTSGVVTRNINLQKK